MDVQPYKSFACGSHPEQCIYAPFMSGWPACLRVMRPPFTASALIMLVTLGHYLSTLERCHP